MSESLGQNVTDVLEHFCTQIPPAVGATAMKNGVVDPVDGTVGTFSQVVGHELTGTEISIRDPDDSRDGYLVLVHHADRSVGDTTHYTLDENLVQTFVTTLLKRTNFVCQQLDDEYDLPDRTLDWEEAVEENVFGKTTSKAYTGENHVDVVTGE